MQNDNISTVLIRFSGYPEKLVAVAPKNSKIEYEVKKPTDNEGMEYYDKIARTLTRKLGSLVFREGMIITQAKIIDGYAELLLSSGDVKANIIPGDLYSLIQPVKKQHFAKYGKSSLEFNYKEKMAALKEGKPQKRLQEDRIARDAVRAILYAGSWTKIQGKDPLIINYGSLCFPEISDDNLTERLYALMNEDGLLDVSFGACGDSGLWCFESETIIQEIKPGYCTDQFALNSDLRKALRTTLEPFKAERTSAFMFNSGFYDDIQTILTDYSKILGSGKDN